MWGRLDGGRMRSICCGRWVGGSFENRKETQIESRQYNHKLTSHTAGAVGRANHGRMQWLLLQLDEPDDFVIAAGKVINFTLALNSV